MKTFKIISINLLVFVLLFIILECISFFILKRQGEDLPVYHYIKNPEIIDKQELLRPIVYGKKGAIAIFGCSFAYGFDLPFEESFSYRLNAVTDKTIINLAFPGEGPAFMYELLQDKNTLEILKKLNPEIFIYVNIPGHNVRHLNYRAHGYNSSLFAIKYKLEKGKLVKNQPSPIFYFLHIPYTAIIIEDFISLIQKEDTKRLNKEFTMLISNSYEIIKKKFPNSKFVIIYYPDGIESTIHDLHPEYIAILESINDDIQIININEEVKDLSDKKYWLNDLSHPSSFAWEKITQIIKKKLLI